MRNAEELGLQCGKGLLRFGPIVSLTGEVLNGVRHVGEATLAASLAKVEHMARAQRIEIAYRSDTYTLFQELQAIC